MLIRLRPQTQALVARWLAGVWLFAILQSLAHACLLQQPQPGQPGHSDSVLASALEVASHLDREQDQGHHQPDAGEALCVKTCDGVESAAWSASSVWLPDLGVALSSAFTPWAQVRDAPARDQIEGSTPPGDPPPSIRFLKLNR